MSKLPIEYLKHVRDELDYITGASRDLNWDVVKNEAPKLKEDIKRLLQASEK